MFAFRLCLALGYPHPDYLLPWLTSTQLTDWEAYYLTEPFGAVHDELLTGIVCATQVNSNPWRGKGSKPAEPIDFMPTQVGRIQQQTPAEMKATLLQWKGVIDGRKNRKT